MSVFGGIMLFVGGVVTGSGAIILHQRDVRHESMQLRRENEHLKNSAWNDRLEFEAYKAYGEGYYDGSRNPMTDVERFADFLERRNVDYKFPKEDTTNDRVPRKARRRP